MREDRLAAVLWDDEPVAEPAAAVPEARSPDRGAHRGAGRTSRGSWRRRVAVVVALVLLVGGGGLLVDHRREATLAARLAATDGLSVDLARPLVTAWRTTGRSVVAAGPGGSLVVRSGEGLAGVDAATGARTFALPGSCVAATGTGVARTTVREGTGPLVCRREDEDPFPGGAPEDRSQDALGDVPLTVHDPATGTLLRTVRLPAREGWWASGDRLVGVGRGADGHRVVTAADLTTGATVWRWRTPSAASPSSWLSARRLDTRTLVLEVGGETTVVDLEDGREVDEDLDAERPRGTPLALPDGTTATTVVTARGLRPSVVVHDADGRERLRLAGDLLVPEVDDGSAPGLLLVQGGRADEGVRAVDATTGEVRWRASARAGQAVLVQGTVLAGTRDGLVALDAADGRTLWSARDERGVESWGFVTDGRRVLRVDARLEGRRLVARDVRSGREAWATALEAAPEALLQRRADGTVLLSVDDEVRRLVPPA
ncbi:PQQ-binding-like beta-propeller repeat protein [Cellulomonas endophytica]|uniref:outer membrane protein assembly factor BamB family protein n=1 Tax=Cellulomonas endophytica TaxID=2494735 RepID=UPI0013E9486E|nr:PQQ-binding-like beta-propeller repeat protein [Cellulomonas endophytica]